MTPKVETLGIIAGSRGLPLKLAEQARLHGVRRIVSVAIEGETDPAIEKVSDLVVWVRVGQLGKLISAFKDQGVRHCVMAGQVAPKNLFDLRPDLRAMKLLFTVKERHAHGLFTAIADELAKDGIELVEATPWLGALLVSPGYHAGPALKSRELEDIRLGHRIALEVSRLDIGQSVVVKEGAILAVEAFEGTDRCLARGGELAGPKGGAVAVKVAKPGHDMRFDIPCAGADTVATCSRHGVRVLALEPGRTLILDRPEVEQACKAGGVSVVAIHGLA